MNSIPALFIQIAIFFFINPRPYTVLKKRPHYVLLGEVREGSSSLARSRCEAGGWAPALIICWDPMFASHIFFYKCAPLSQYNQPRDSLLFILPRTT